MKRIIVLSILTITLILTGCTNNSTNEPSIVNYDYKFVGENESWNATFIVTGEDVFDDKGDSIDYEGKSDFSLTVQYKNDISELSEVKKIEISYSSALKNGNLVLQYPEDGSIEKTFTLKSSSNGIRIDKDEIIIVTIKVDNELNEIELRYSPDSNSN